MWLIRNSQAAGNRETERESKRQKEREKKYRCASANAGKSAASCYLKCEEEFNSPE